MALNRIQKITRIIEQSESCSRDEIVNKLRKEKKEFKKFYKYYEQSDEILTQKEDDPYFTDKLNQDNNEKIVDQIKLLNEMDIKSIYNEIFNDNNNGEYEMANEEEQNNEEDHKEEYQYQAQLINNQEMLKVRGEELQKIHKTAAQIKDMTQNMANELQNQAEQLDNIESNVEKAHNNAVEAKKEIETADKISKGNSKRPCCIIIIILIAIGGIAAIVISLLVK
jgi:t-SNARE complex subunit (syntaxin)